MQTLSPSLRTWIQKSRIFFESPLLNQLTVIERLLGIVPHLTRNRQASRAAASKRAS
jgi:hypothetical protein